MDKDIADVFTQTQKSSDSRKRFFSSGPLGELFEAFLRLSYSIQLIMLCVSVYATGVALYRFTNWNIISKIMLQPAFIAFCMVGTLLMDIVFRGPDLIVYSKKPWILKFALCYGILSSYLLTYPFFVYIFTFL